MRSGVYFCRPGFRLPVVLWSYPSGMEPKSRNRSTLPKRRSISRGFGGFLRGGLSFGKGRIRAVIGDSFRMCFDVILFLIPDCVFVFFCLCEGVCARGNPEPNE